MSAHTPGPWSIHRVAATAVVGSTGFVVAACGGYSTNTRDAGEVVEELQANAHLIAAAPELLEAVRRLMPRPLTGNPTHAQLVEFWTHEKEQGRGAAADVLFALAAIAKAVQS